MTRRISFAPKKKKEIIEKVARWLRLRDWRNGQMVDEYDTHSKYWRDEAKKIIRIIEREQNDID